MLFLNNVSFVKMQTLCIRSKKYLKLTETCSIYLSKIYAQDMCVVAYV